MTQHDYNIGNASGATVRTDLNNLAGAIATHNSGGTAPTTTYAYMFWADTAAGLLKIRNGANTSWVTVGVLDSTNLALLALTGGSLTGAIELDAFADLASGGTTDIGAQTTNFVRVTGVTGITSFGTATAGVWRILRFAGALTITHNAVSLILPTAASITTAANDSLLAISLGSGSWFVAIYQRGDGTPLAGGAGGASALSLQTGTTHSPAVSDTGKTFSYTNAAGCAVSLPAVSDGINFRMINRATTSAAILTITASGRLFSGGGSFVKIQNEPGFSVVEVMCVSSVWETSTRKWKTDPKAVAAGNTTDVHSHGLGVNPTTMQLFYRCVNSQQGWQPGQEFAVDQMSYDLAGTAGSGGHYWCGVNSVNVNFTRVGVYDGVNPTTGNQATLTAGNFRTRVVVTF